MAAGEHVTQTFEARHGEQFLSSGKAAYAGWKRAQAEAVEIVSPRDVERVLRATEKLGI
jgi:hypothetical protein